MPDATLEPSQGLGEEAAAGPRSPLGSVRVF